MVPRSRCPQCDAQISAWQNIPVFSWLALRGRCAACNSRISARYPAVEVLTALLSLTVVAVFGYTWDAMFALFFSWLLITMALIDFDTRLLPDNLTLPLLWLGLLFNLRGGFVDLQSAVIGAAVGYLILWSIYWVFKLLTGKDGMGYGDFKLLAALGAWLGWQALPMVILISSVVGILLGGTVLLIRKSREPIPFGPFLAIAGWVCLVRRDSVVAFVLT
jgi:leader peptidase (prepilin peptidase)/N-methyltransferase